MTALRSGTPATVARVTDNTTPIATPEHTVDGFVREFLRELNFGQGVDLTRSLGERQVPRHGAHRAPLPAWSAGWRRCAGSTRSRRSPSRTCRRSSCWAGSWTTRCSPPTSTRSSRRGWRPLGIDLADAARRGGRARPRQRRPRPARRVLHRLARDDERAVHRLRHPLRVRHLPPDVRRRLAGREARQLAGARVSPWEFPHPESAVTVDFGGHTEHVRRRRRRRAPAGCRAGASSASPTTTWSPATENGRVNTLRLWSARRRGRSTWRSSTPATTREAVRAQTFAENISKVLYPEDSTPAGQGAAPPAAVLLRRVLDARLHRPGAAGGLRPAQPARAHHLPAQRHPPRHRDPRAHADPRRRAAAGSGTRPGRSPRSASPTPATRCCPRRSRSGRSSCSGGCCRGTSRSSTGSTRSSSPSCASAYPDDELRVRRMSIIAEYPERAVRMAYLATVAGAKVNGVAALHSQLLRGQGAARLLRATARTSSPTSPTASRPRRFVRLANPGLSGLITDGDRRRLGHRPGPARASSSRCADDADFRERVPRGQARRTSSGWSTCWRRATASSCRPGHHARRHGQAAARVQAADPQAAAHRHAVRPDHAPAR